MATARWLVALLLLLVLAACQPAPAATPSAAPTTAPTNGPTPTPSEAPAESLAADEIVVTVSVTGGECPNGPCGASYTIYGDGRVDGLEDPLYAIPGDQMTLIADQVGRTNWDAVRAVPFTGECPTAFDGQKHVYAFPAETGDLVFDSCEFDLSSVPAIQAIDAALFGG